MKKSILFATILLAWALATHAQTDTMYVMKAGVVVKKYNIHTQIDSLTFYKPANTPDDLIKLQMVDIPAGSFIIGSPTTEVGRDNGEKQGTAWISAFRMSKYEITNAQFAAFLNAIGVGNDRKYWAGEYPTEILLLENYWGVIYENYKWTSNKGLENYPVVSVTWFGADEFARYVGGKLPTAAEWEYACRAGSTTAFNTGDCLSYQDANYKWSEPYNNCTNDITTKPGQTEEVGSYPPNAFGLYDMHGNVSEWCNDLIGSYSRAVRGGSWQNSAKDCRSAKRNDFFPGAYITSNGFRVVLVP